MKAKLLGSIIITVILCSFGSTVFANVGGGPKPPIIPCPNQPVVELSVGLDAALELEVE